MPSRGLSLSLAVVSLMACASPPSHASRLTVAPSSAAPVVAPPVPSIAPAPLASLPLARPSLPTTIGDVTCATDADCTTTTRADCCECCATNARATSKAWLAWRDGTECPKTRCEPCGKVKCPYFGDPTSLRAVCIQGACALVPDDEPD